MHISTLDTQQLAVLTAALNRFSASGRSSRKSIENILLLSLCVFTKRSPRQRRDFRRVSAIDRE